MEMCYDGALVMPSNYAVLDEEEMTYVEGGKEYTAYFTNVKAAKKYYYNIGGRLQIFALATGLASTVLSGTLGAVASWAGGIIGSIVCGLGTISSTIIYGWGSKYIDCANSLSRYNNKKKCAVTWNSSGVNLSYTISVR